MLDARPKSRDVPKDLSDVKKELSTSGTLGLATMDSYTFYVYPKDKEGHLKAQNSFQSVNQLRCARKVMQAYEDFITAMGGLSAISKTNRSLPLKYQIAVFDATALTSALSNTIDDGGAIIEGPGSYSSVVLRAFVQLDPTTHQMVCKSPSSDEIVKHLGDVYKLVPPTSSNQTPGLISR